MTYLEGVMCSECVLSVLGQLFKKSLLLKFKPEGCKNRNMIFIYQ